MEGLTGRRNVFGAELSCRIEMSSENRGTRVGSHRYRSRETRKLMASLVLNSIVRPVNFRRTRCQKYFICLLLSVFFSHPVVALSQQRNHCVWNGHRERSFHTAKYIFCSPFALVYRCNWRCKMWSVILVGGKTWGREAWRDSAMRESAATRSHYKILIGDLRAGRVGTLNINVSSSAVVSPDPCTPGDSEEYVQ